MFFASPRHGGGKTGSKPGSDKQGESKSPVLVGLGQEQGLGDIPGNVGQPLDLAALEVPGRIWRTRRVTVPLLLLVLLMASTVVVVVLAGRQAGSPAPVLACPEGWVGYRRVCYYFSEPKVEEGSWDWSLEQCFSLGASLAVLQRDWELKFLNRLRSHFDYWLGLQRRGERLEWVDGSSFNQTVQVWGEGECVFLNDGHLISAACHQLRPYLCSKPQILP